MNGDKPDTNKPLHTTWAKRRMLSGRDREVPYIEMDKTLFNAMITQMKNEGVDSKHLEDLKTLFTNVTLDNIHSVKISNNETRVEQFLDAYRMGDISTLIHWAKWVTFDEGHDVRVEALKAFFEQKITKAQFIEINLIVTLSQMHQLSSITLVKLDDENEKTQSGSLQDEYLISGNLIKAQLAEEPNKTSHQWLKIQFKAINEAQSVSQALDSIFLANRRMIIPYEHDTETSNNKIYTAWIPPYTLLSRYFENTKPEDEQAVDPKIIYGDCTFLQQHAFQKDGGRALFLELPSVQGTYQFHNTPHNAAGGTLHDIFHICTINPIPKFIRDDVLILAEALLEILNQRDDIENSTCLNNNIVSFEDLLFLSYMFEGEDPTDMLFFYFKDSYHFETGIDLTHAFTYSNKPAVNLFTLLLAIYLKADKLETLRRRGGNVPEFLENLQAALEVSAIIPNEELADIYTTQIEILEELNSKHNDDGNHPKVYYAQAAIAIMALEHQRNNDPALTHEGRALLLQNVGEIMENPELVKFSASSIQTPQNDVKALSLSIERRLPGLKP